MFNIEYLLLTFILDSKQNKECIYFRIIVFLCFYHLPMRSFFGSRIHDKNTKVVLYKSKLSSDHRHAINVDRFNLETM